MVEYDYYMNQRFTKWYQDLYAQNPNYSQKVTYVFNLGILLSRFPVLSEDLKNLNIRNESLPRSEHQRKEFQKRYTFNRGRIPEGLTDENIYRLFISFLEEDQQRR